MKGQVNVEYLVALGIFVTIVSYVYLSLNQSIPGYLTEVRKEATISDAYLLSEVLIDDPGEPADWENYLETPDEIKRIGLADESYNQTNMISEQKIDFFEWFCSNNYEETKKKLGMDRDFSVIIKDIENDQLLVSCQPSQIKVTAINVTFRRIVAYNRLTGEKGYAEVIVQMW
jgi:hypothetical protein